jgi:hypothetical protein
VTGYDRGRGGVKNYQKMRDTIIEWPLSCVQINKWQLGFAFILYYMVTLNQYKVLFLTPVIKCHEYGVYDEAMTEIAEY